MQDKSQHVDPASTLRGVLCEICTRTVGQKVQFVFVIGYSIVLHSFIHSICVLALTNPTSFVICLGE